MLPHNEVDRHPTHTLEAYLTRTEYEAFLAEVKKHKFLEYILPGIPTLPAIDFSDARSRSYLNSSVQDAGN